MSNPFKYDYNNEMRKPLTKYQALKLAVTLMSLPHIELEGKFAENYIDELFDVAEQILQKDANEINEYLASDKQFAYDEIKQEKAQV